jgi:Tol biopolymer transport system component
MKTALAIFLAAGVVLLGRGLAPQAESEAALSVVRSSAPSDTVRGVARRVMTGMNATPVGAPTADGRYLTTTDWESGDLALYDLESRSLHRLTHKGSWEADGSFADMSIPSRDGRLVAYTWFSDSTQRAELRLIGIDGADQRVLVDHPQIVWIYPADWSSNSRDVLVTLNRLDRTTQLALVDSEHGSLRVLRSFDWQRAVGTARISPDGRYVAFSLSDDREGSADVHVMGMDGDGERILKNPANDELLDWTPDGDHLLILSERGGTPAIYLQPITEGRPEGPAVLIKPEAWRVWGMGITDAGRFYYGVQISAREARFARLEPSSGKVIGTSEPLTTHRPLGGTMRPEWSPDGRMVAYLSQANQTLATRRLRIRALEQGVEQEILLELGYANRLRWSPDGSTILVGGRDRNDREGFLLVNVRTGHMNFRVVQFPSAEEGARLYEWAPDGESVLYYHGRILAPGRFQGRIMRYALESGDTGVVYQLPDSLAAVADFWTLARSGEALAYKGSPKSGAGWHLVVVMLPEGEERHIATFANIVKGGVAWSPDEDALLVYGRPTSADSMALYRVALADGDVKLLGLAKGNEVARMRVHPDGDRIAFTEGHAEFEIWVLENFLPRHARAAAK